MVSNLDQRFCELSGNSVGPASIGQIFCCLDPDIATSRSKRLYATFRVEKGDTGNARRERPIPLEMPTFPAPLPASGITELSLRKRPLRSQGAPVARPYINTGHIAAIRRRKRLHYIYAIFMQSTLCNRPI